MVDEPTNPGTSATFGPKFGETELANFRRGVIRQQQQVQQQLSLVEAAQGRGGRQGTGAYRPSTTVTNNVSESTGINDGLRGDTGRTRTTTTRFVDTPAGPRLTTVTDSPAAEAASAYDTVAGQEA
jgi:hypothetical protein